MDNILLFIGFQALGTLGREIYDGAKEVSIYNHKVKVNCEIRKIDGYSGHKDSDHLQEFVATANEGLKKVLSPTQFDTWKVKRKEAAKKQGTQPAEDVKEGIDD